MMGVASEKGEMIWAKPTARGSRAANTSTPASRQGSRHRARRRTMAKRHTADRARRNRFSTTSTGVVKELEGLGQKKNRMTCLYVVRIRLGRRRMG